MYVHNLYGDSFILYIKTFLQVGQELVEIIKHIALYTVGELNRNCGSMRTKVCLTQVQGNYVCIKKSCIVRSCICYD